MLLITVNMPYIKGNYHFPKSISKGIAAYDNLMKIKCDLHSVCAVIVNYRYGNVLIGFLGHYYNGL